MSKREINIKNNVPIKKIYSNYFFTALFFLFLIIACTFLALTSEDLKYAKRIYFFVIPFLFLIFLFFIIKSIYYFRIGICRGKLHIFRKKHLSVIIQHHFCIGIYTAGVDLNRDFFSVVF